MIFNCRYFIRSDWSHRRSFSIRRLKKFEVYEDPRIAQVQEVLPGANCGGCGYPGCGGFATACVKPTRWTACYAP